MPLLDAVERYLRWLTCDAYRIDAGGLATYRIVYAVFLLCYGIPTIAWVSLNPSAFFFPPNVSLPKLLFDDFPSLVTATALSLGIVGTLLCILVGWWTRTASVLFSVLCVVALSFAFSFGKIDHNLIVWIIPFVLAASGWGRVGSLDAQGRSSDDTAAPVRGSPVAVVALLIGFGMFTAGAQKIHGGWLDPGTQAVQGYVVQAVEVFGRDPILGALFLQIESAAVWEVLDISVVLFETGFLLAFFHPTAFRVFLGSAFAFHLGVFLVMGIRTEILIVAYILVLVPWGQVARWVQQQTRPLQAERYAPLWRGLAIAALATTAALFTWDVLHPDLADRYLSLFDVLDGK